MSLYQKFIGIDIGKFNFVVALHGDKTTHEYEYEAKGITRFLNEFKNSLPQALIVLETTRGYEMELLLTLCDHQFTVHRANTRKVKSFILSFGNSAKTDALDARALALYGSERNERLELFSPVPKNLSDLYNLVQRRKDLKQLLVAEKNRSKGPKAELIKDSCELMIKTVNEQIEHITLKIETIISSDKSLSARKEILRSIPGIGSIISQDLLTLMPELGTMNRREAASISRSCTKSK
jgi:transposase